MESAIREWRLTEWFDRGFLRNVRQCDLKVFVRAFRLLSDVASAQVRSSLFAGVKRPFHYIKTTGWMRRLLYEGMCDREISTFVDAASAIREIITWPEEATVFLVYHQPNAYVTSWGNFLRYFQKDCMNLDTMLVCHPTQREIVLFWEDSCVPFFGKRGNRELACPI